MPSPIPSHPLKRRTERKKKEMAFDVLNQELGTKTLPQYRIQILCKVVTRGRGSLRFPVSTQHHNSISRSFTKWKF
jgi:hypothetical protein